MQIKDKKAIIIGALSRLEIYFCRELLRNGAGKIVIIGYTNEFENALDDLNLEFGQKRAIFTLCDLSNSIEFDATFKEIVTNLGGLDILINNADLVDESNISTAIDINVTAVIRSTLLGIQQMEKDLGGKGGIIINITTIFGLEPTSKLPIYSTAKQAVISFSRSFSHPYHYERTGVKLIMFCPEFSEGLKSRLETIDGLLEKSETSQEGIHFQKEDTIAHGLVYLIRCAQNGSIWVSENSQPVYEIQLPNVLPQKQNEENLMDSKCIE